MIMMEKLGLLLLKLLHVLLRKVGKKVSNVEGNEEYMDFFVIEPIAAPSACSFLPGAVNLAKPSLRHHYRARNWTFDKNHFWSLLKVPFKTDLLVKTV